MTTHPELERAAYARAASEKELAATVMLFEAAVFRGEAGPLATITEAAHAALQNHLDAIASIFAVARKVTR